MYMSQNHSQRYGTEGNLFGSLNDLSTKVFFMKLGSYILVDILNE